MAHQNPADHPPADQSVTTRSSVSAPSARCVLMLGAVAMTAYLIDLATKTWVVSTMVEGDSIDVLPPFLDWHFIRNPGAAFSIGTDFTWFFTIIMAVVVCGIILQIRRIHSAGWAIALGLVLGGALGNLTDRLFREPSFGQGHVVDFIALPNFAIFNIADMAVVSGVVLICLYTLRGVGMDGRRSNEADSDGEGQEKEASA
ncbi:signal peptidase II [Arthrobacter roseus]|uniref:signal peptidase II n=1 Tax=Arthrobacter roseus TaxID=136274 RepID=UPI001964B2A0|nr:signal peptidase II [Arthrobacter roseus]MBM7848344.1 signal peptidase II [Arthrobacter roseus]